MTGVTSRSRGTSAGSLKVSASFRAFVLDQLGELEAVTARSMFGGVGLYCGDSFFGILARDTLYLKVDDSNRSEYERVGMHPFKPYPNRPVTMKYDSVPIAILESPTDLVAWARKAIGVARSQAR